MPDDCAASAIVGVRLGDASSGVSEAADVDDDADDENDKGEND